MSVVEAISKKIKKEICNRKLVFWGGWGNDCDLKKSLLEKLHMEEVLYVTTDIELARSCSLENNKPIVHISKVDGKAEEYYIVSFPKQTDEIDRMFSNYGYYCTDIAHINHRQIEVNENNYVDEYGNTVSNLSTGVQVYIDGYNNRIKIGKVNCKEQVLIYCGSNVTLEIADDVRFVEKFKMLLADVSGDSELDAKVIIAKKCKFVSGVLTCFSGSVYIDEESTFERNFQMTCSPGMAINIGKDCMFSHDIVLLSGDGHKTFSCETCMPINIYDCLSDEKKKIVIEDHVWVGWRTMILNGAFVGRGCQIGANSFVKKIYPNNSILAGNPAKVLRKNIAWCRTPISKCIKNCGEGNISFTSDDRISSI